MEKHSLAPSGIKREARGLLGDNWSRAISVLCLSLMAVTVFMLANQLVLSLVEEATLLQDSAETGLPKNPAQFLEYINSQSARLNVMISAVMALFYFLIISPMNLGGVNWYQSLALCSNLQVGQVFYFYRSNELFINALVFELARLARHFAVLAVGLAPSAVCFGMAFSYSLEGASASQKGLVVPLLIAGAALLVVGFIVYAFVILRWFVAKYLFVGGHGYGVGDCFRYSAKFMKGKVGKVLALYLSCVPMWLCGALVITLIFIIPMTNAILAAAAQDIIDENISG